MPTIKYANIESALSVDKMVGSNHKITRLKLGVGTFGEVRIGKNINTDELVAIKIERIIQDKKSADLYGTIRLRTEYEMLKFMYRGYPLGHKINGLPQIFLFARSQLRNTFTNFKKCYKFCAV